jgi:hypothetical protein
MLPVYILLLQLTQHCGNSAAAAAQATCADINVATAAMEAWSCPPFQRLLPESALLSPPSHELCCTVSVQDMHSKVACC